MGVMNRSVVSHAMLLAMHCFAASATASDLVVAVSSAQGLGPPPQDLKALVAEYWATNGLIRLHAETSVSVAGRAKAVRLQPTQHSSGDVGWGICLIESVTPRPEFPAQRRAETFTKHHLLLWRHGKVVASFDDVAVQGREYTRSGCALLSR